MNDRNYYLLMAEEMCAVAEDMRNAYCRALSYRLAEDYVKMANTLGGDR